MGREPFEKVRGIDDSEVSNDWTRKSLGEQETFAQDTHDQTLIAERLDAMAERIIAALKTQQFTGFRTVTITVRFGDFQTTNRSRSPKEGIAVDDNGPARLKATARMLILPFFDTRKNPQAKAFRLIGLRVEKLF